MVLDELRRVFDGLVLVDIVANGLDVIRVVAQPFEGHGNGPVDQLEHAAAGQELVLDQGDVRLDPRRVAVHQEADRPGRRQDRRLGVAETHLAAGVERLVPGVFGRVSQVVGAMRLGDVVGMLAVHVDDLQHGVLVLLELDERSLQFGDFGADGVGGSRHDRADRRGQRTGLVRIVGHRQAHHQRAEIREPQAQRAEPMAVDRNRLVRVAAVVDQDLLGDDEQANRLFEPVDVKGAVFLAEFHQVQRSEVAGRVVDEHVLAARVGGVDGPGVGAGVPAVYRAVVLDAGVAADAGAFGDQLHQLAGGMLAQLFAGSDRVGDPDVILLCGLQKLVGHTDGQVGVLEHDAVIGFTVVLAAVAGLDERPGLLFFDRLAGDELLDVGMVDLERLHLGGPAGLAAGLDHRRDLVIDPHKAQRARRLAPPGELLFAASQC